jgi:hypothetical protein
MVDKSKRGDGWMAPGMVNGQSISLGPARGGKRKREDDSAISGKAPEFPPCRGLSDVKPGNANG